MKSISIVFFVLAAWVAAIAITVSALEDRIEALEQQVANLEARADHIGLRQAVLDVKMRMLVSELITANTDPELRGLKE